MVRSGLVKLEDYRETLGSTIGGLMLRTGRKSRSLEDTAVASHLLRDGSPNWSELRRGQDYYFEGRSSGSRPTRSSARRPRGASLDDFCKKFLGKNRSAEDVVPYDLTEVVKHLKDTAEHDWETFLKSRVERPLDALPLELVGRIGYRLQYAARSPRPMGTDVAVATSRPGTRWGSASAATARSSTWSPAWSATARDSHRDEGDGGQRRLTAPGSRTPSPTASPSARSSSC